MPKLITGEPSNLENYPSPYSLTLFDQMLNLLATLVANFLEERRPYYRSCVLRPSYRSLRRTRDRVSQRCADHPCVPPRRRTSRPCHPLASRSPPVKPRSFIELPTRSDHPMGPSLFYPLSGQTLPTSGWQPSCLPRSAALPSGRPCGRSLHKTRVRTSRWWSHHLFVQLRLRSSHPSLLLPFLSPPTQRGPNADWATGLSGISSKLDPCPLYDRIRRPEDSRPIKFHDIARSSRQSFILDYVTFEYAAWRKTERPERHVGSSPHSRYNHLLVLPNIPRV